MTEPDYRPPAIVATGIGGRLELVDNHLRLIKGGIFGHLVELLWLGHGVLIKSIPLRQIAAIEIVRPMLLPDFVRIAYAGAPTPKGHFLEDALADNALIMNPFDNRRFYEIKERIEAYAGPEAAMAPEAVALARRAPPAS